MDKLGRVARDFLAMEHANNVRNAKALASELRSEGMTRGQIEEMLHASGFESSVILEALGNAIGGNKK